MLAGSKHKSLAVCYLRHAFALGEHYNSIVSVKEDSSDEDEGFEEVTSSTKTKPV